MLPAPPPRPRRTALVYGALALAVLGLGATVYAAQTFTARDPALHVACETALRDRLVAPATYRRIELSDTVRKITPEEAVPPLDPGLEDNPRAQQAHRSLMEVHRDNDPHLYTVLMRFDAFNARGVPIQVLAMCKHVALRPRSVADLDVAPYDIEIIIDPTVELMSDSPVNRANLGQVHWTDRDATGQ